MKIDEFFARFPERKIRAALCADRVTPTKPPLEVAEGLVRGYRQEQVALLAQLMRSPVTVRIEEGDAQSRVGGPRDAFEILEPRQTARRFVVEAGRLGKELSRFEAADLESLSADDQALARVLRLIARAQESPRQRREQGERWQTLRSGKVDLGAVLGPMVVRVGDERAPEPGDKDVAELIGLLEVEYRKDSKVHERPNIERWVPRLIYEGAKRLRELGADGQARRHAQQG